jgi:hypothetical protein
LTHKLLVDAADLRIDHMDMDLLSLSFLMYMTVACNGQTSHFDDDDLSGTFAIAAVAHERVGPVTDRVDISLNPTTCGADNECKRADNGG